MIAVDFKSMAPGVCGWCRKEREEVYNVAFSDKSFVGLLCRSDLLRAVGMKLGSEPKPIPALPVKDGAAAK